MRHIVAVVLLAGCGGAERPAPAPAPPSAAPDAAPAFRFDWSPPCEVEVTERLSNATRPYVFRLRIAEARDTLTVEKTQGRELSTAQHPISPAEQQLVDKLDALHGAWTIEVSPRGEVRERARAARPGAYRSRFEGDDGATNLWGTWVGHWIDWPLAAGASSTETGDGGAVTTTREHLGVVDGRVHLRETERRFRDGALSREIVREVQLDAATLRPHVARHEERHLPSESETGRQVWRSHTFDWAHATGCDD
jgi:hypothetical protein